MNPLETASESKKIKFSFEFFPPANAKIERMMWRSMGQFMLLDPEFVSVTYGAGGSTQEKSIQIVEQMQVETSVPTAAHLTCVGASKSEVNAVAQKFWDLGISRIVALRGDPQGETQAFTAHPDGYTCAAELVEGLRQLADFDISVAAYPEMHPEAQSPQADIDYLKRKLDAGANRAITQYFFDTETYEVFLNKCIQSGIEKDIVPGIMPIHNFKKIVNFSQRCGAGIPWQYEQDFERHEHDPVGYRQLSIDLAVEQCRQLQDIGVMHFHFYTLNRSDLCYEIAKALLI
ncbi:MAG TPA: methylenetetrahydrofolate reductase [NAD(P)H] [Gammaproteobacteria bacterium]|nr:methylenetetrahydrofolate reductase [NAD(P)H] [Gammaproteobacteria bacterium]